ncbi:MAG: glycosyl hydrolase 53 family protein [Bacteroidota bacterium]
MKLLSPIVLVLLLIACDATSPINFDCTTESELDNIATRTVSMGFSTWSFGPRAADRNETYGYIKSHGDIYSEQVDDRIPWRAWMQGTDLPEEFVADIDYRVGQRTGLPLILSVSLLNTGRDDLIEDWNGEPITYTRMDDRAIEDAYVAHVQYLVDRLSPDFLVVAMESNDLLLHAPQHWEAFTSLMRKVRARLTVAYPNLRIGESITLHSFYEPSTEDPNAYLERVTNYVNDLDFTAVSFYPFFKNQHTKVEYQSALDFLQSRITNPVGMVETNHLAEDLDVPSLDTFITGNPCEQKEYLETLLLHAHSQQFLFVIWWAYKDYDALWATFPADIQPIGQIWRDTGLLDENDTPRPAHAVWESFLER